MSRKKNRANRRKKTVTQGDTVPARRYSGLTVWGLIVVGVALAAFAIGPFARFDLAQQQAEEASATATENVIPARADDGSALPLDPGAPPIQFRPGRIEFGESAPNTMHDAVAQITNTGRETLQIVRGGASCPCTQLELPARRRLEPGASMNINITMDSENRAGLKTVTARVFAAGFEAPATLPVTVTVIE